MLNNILKVSLLFIVITFTVSFSIHAAQNENVTEKADASASENSEKGDRDYIYDPSGKTDPFRSFITAQQEQMEKERGEPKTILETLELSQLKLTSIIVSDKGKWAMVTDSKKEGHVIKEGTPIGRDGGVVYKINPGEVIIREEYRDFRGETKYREIFKKSPSIQQD
ncbi:pilus assembly protein PilP [Thermodesulfobacteriota bacterium]